MKSFKQWRRSRLVAALRGMQEREVREVIKEAWPGFHMARNQPGGKRKGALDEYAKAVITEIEKEEVGENGER